MLDVLAIDLATHKVRILDRNKSPENAEAIIRFVIARRGVATEFYVTAPAGTVKDGADWRTSHA